MFGYLYGRQSVPASALSLYCLPLIAFVLLLTLSFSDTIEHCSDARHIVVYHQGRWFKVLCYQNGVLLGAPELELTFQRIMDDTSEPVPGERDLAALTAGERTPWANVSGSNKNKKNKTTIKMYTFTSCDVCNFLVLSSCKLI